MQILHASPLQVNKTLYYPLALSGLRANYPCSFENAHRLGRDGVSVDFASLPVTEKFELVVGAGISGLAAACFWQQLQDKPQRILLIDNHDDFGGHAKRNEHSSSNGTILGYGGSQSFQSPYSNFSPVMMGLIKRSVSAWTPGSEALIKPSIRTLVSVAASSVIRKTSGWIKASAATRVKWWLTISHAIA